MRSTCCADADRHLPIVVMDNFLRRLILPPKKKVARFIRKGAVVADVGCGPGYFTIPIAEMAGPTGRVYAVDSDPKSIQAVEAKSKAQGLQGVINTQTTSAAHMEGIPDGTVDFVFANGVICCMTDHDGAIAHIRRILKPEGLAYLSVSRMCRRNDPKAVRKNEWNDLLSKFDVKERGERLTSRWAVIASRAPET